MRQNPENVKNHAHSMLWSRRQALRTFEEGRDQRQMLKRNCDQLRLDNWVQSGKQLGRKKGTTCETHHLRESSVSEHCVFMYGQNIVGPERWACIGNLEIRLGNGETKKGAHETHSGFV